MNGTQYNPEIHHRRSIRLKGHDYAGGGLYFVTICAHKNAGNIFSRKDVQEMVAHIWESVGAGLRGIGNPALWNVTKTGILCSRNGAPSKEELANKIPDAAVYLGGFHSPPEQAILAELLKRKANIIYCPAWGLKGAVTPNITNIDALP